MSQVPEDDILEEDEPLSAIGALNCTIGAGPPQIAEFTFENRWTSGPLK